MVLVFHEPKKMMDQLLQVNHWPKLQEHTDGHQNFIGETWWWVSHQWLISNRSLEPILICFKHEKLSVWLGFSLSIYLSIDLNISIYLPIYLKISLHICVISHISLSPSPSLSIDLSIHPSICLSLFIYPPIYLFIYRSIHLRIYPYLYISVSASVSSSSSSGHD